MPVESKGSHQKIVHQGLGEVMDTRMYRTVSLKRLCDVLGAILLGNLQS